MKLLFIAGARPNFMKIAPLIKEAKKYRSITSVLVHTGQHYDENMSEVFFRELNIPAPNYSLEIGSGSHTEQTAKAMERLEPVVLKEMPDAVVVVGDVNSSLAGALVASKLNIFLAHVEAGCRSFDREMPEEINRLLIDRIANALFVTSRFEQENLVREGVAKKTIFMAGNIMTDTLLDAVKESRSSHVLKRLSLKPKTYGVLTLHRAGNVDKKASLKELLEAIAAVSSSLPLVFPAHPRVQKMIDAFGLDAILHGKPVQITEPLSYLDMVALLKGSRMVLTDSGSLQHETTVLGIPCVTLKKTTEWPITVTMGTNVIAGTSKADIVKNAMEALKKKTQRRGKRPPLWDGKTAKRIIAILTREVKKT